jgi:hypothetical protein
MYEKPFSPRGKTVIVAAATTAPTGIQVGEIGTVGGYQFRIHNAGTVTAYIAFGASAADAQTNAVIPTAGTPQYGIPLPAGIVEVLSFPIGSYLSAITASGTADIFVTQGAGV